MTFSQTSADRRGELGEVRFRQLPNGIRVLAEPMAHLRSASVGLYLDAGSRFEQAEECGVAHFIEHMLFKGTSQRNSYQLSVEQNLLGGNVNAYTSQEHIVLNARVVNDHWERALSLLIEMLTDSQFDPEEFERERGVILEEYKMYDDTPDELVMDQFMEGLFDGHPLGRPILGTPDHLRRFRPEDLRNYLTRVVRPDRLVVAATGGLDPDAFLDRVEGLLGHLSIPASQPVPTTPIPTPAYHHRILDRDLEQTHFVLGTTGPNRLDDRRFSYAVMSAILGAGPGSRIFQEVREKRGLAYSIGTFEWYFQDTGCFAISGGTSAETYEEVESLCLAEVGKLSKEPPTVEELECARAQIRTGVVLGAESSGGRMARLAEQELWYGRLIPMDETLSKLDAVTPETVMESVTEWLSGRPFTAAIVGENPREPLAKTF